MPFQSLGSRLSLCFMASVMPCPLMFSIAGTANGIGLRAEAQRDRDRHRRQHMRGVVFLVDGLVADDRPAGGLHHFDIEAVLGIKAQRRRHDDRRRAGDRDEADLQVLLFRRASIGKGLGRGLDREELRDRGQRRRGADRFQEGAARGILWKHRPHHCGGDDALVALLFVLDRLATQRQRRVFMLGCGAMLAADAAGARELTFGIKWIIECGHTAPLCHTGAQRKSHSAAIRQIHRRPAAFRVAGRRRTCRFYAALPVNAGSSRSPSSIGSEGSRDHSFQEPKYIRTSFTPAFLSARNVFDARAPLKQ